MLHSLTNNAAQEQYIIICAGVVGLTTALELHAQHPDSHVILLAKHFPNDRSIEYTSPWAGANWLSVATDNGRQEKWDEITFNRFAEISEKIKEAGIERMDIRAVFDNDIENAGVLSQGTGKVWYEKLVGGLRWVDEAELPEGTKFGFQCGTFVIDVSKYLPWYDPFFP